MALLSQFTPAAAPGSNITSPEKQDEYLLQLLKSNKDFTLRYKVLGINNKTPFGTMFLASFCRLLQKYPHLADECDFSNVAPELTTQLVIARPDLLERFGSDRVIWPTLLQHRSEMIKYYSGTPHITRPAWVNILCRQPELFDYAPWQRFTSKEWISLLTAHPRFADKCPWHKKSYSCEWQTVLLTHPDVILKYKPEWQPFYTLKNLSKTQIAALLSTAPHLEELADFSVFDKECWEVILAKQPQFIKYCDVPKHYTHIPLLLLFKQPELAKHFSGLKLASAYLKKAVSFAIENSDAGVHLLAVFGPEEWEQVLHSHPEFLCFRKAEGFSSGNSIRAFVASRFWDFDALGLDSICNNIYKLLEQKLLTPGGLFAEKTKRRSEPMTAAEFLLKNTMDPDNGKRYFLKMLRTKMLYAEEIHNLAPEIVHDFFPAEKLPFVYCVTAPDSLWKKYLKFRGNPASFKDQNGNTLLHAALLRAVLKSFSSFSDPASPHMACYRYLLACGCDPDQKNKAGFSCNDLLVIIKNKISELFLAAEKYTC